MISITRFKRWPTNDGIVAAIAAALLLAGCASVPRIIARPVALPLPSRPVLPALTGAELRCLADSTYSKLVHRDRGWKRWGLQLEAIIQANNRQANQGAATDGRD